MLQSIIHTPQTMTVRQYSRFEQTHDLRLLIRFELFRIIPVKWLTKYFEGFTKEFNKLFNPDSGGELYKQIDKLLFQNKLMQMQALAEAIYVHLVHKVKLDILKAKIGMKSTPDEALAGYIERIKDISGVEIKTLQDVADFRTVLEHDIDKFEELFVEKKQPVKGATILELFYIYCSVLEINPSYIDMTLYEFSELKRQAEEKNKRIQEQLKKK